MMLINPQAGVDADLLFGAGRGKLVNNTRIVFNLLHKGRVPLLYDAANLLHSSLHQLIDLFGLVNAEGDGLLDDLGVGLFEREHK